jgi:gamma-glutamyltranspeptidase/glutathione hydrolase
MKSKRIYIFTMVILILALLLSCGEQKPTGYFKGALATVHPLATEIGKDILIRGGNAADCAVAVGFTLAVVYPQAGNIGGGGFALAYIKDSSMVTTLDFREKAPIFATEKMYLDSNDNIIENASLLGYKAAAVPGTVAGLLTLHRRFGSMPIEDLINPAIRLAEDGFIVDSILASDLEQHKDELAQFKTTTDIFWKSVLPLMAGDTLIQKDLAASLKRVRDYGWSGFYGGQTASLLESFSQANGGLMTLVDLKEYKPVWRAPIAFEYDNLKIYSMGPPSSGGILLAQIFNMAANFDLPHDSPYNPIFVHLFTEACKRAFADRAEYLGDADYVDFPLARLISKDYAKKRISDFDPLKATPADQIGPGLDESESTTHFSIVDRYGNAIGITYTINATFGAKVVADSLGFFLNNEMDDFVAKPGVPNLYGLVGGEANKIAPQKRPLSSMSPTLVFKNDSLLMVTGSPGGSKIITNVALSIFRYFNFKQTITETANQPRYHHQHLPDTLYYEENAFEAKAIEKLTDMGHTLKVRDNYGNLNIVARENVKRKWEAVSDNRRKGSATVLY